MTATPLPGTAGLDLERAESFPHWTHEVLRFSDTDAFGHINNGAYASCFENARIKLTRRIGAEAAEGEVDWVLARLCIDYRAQLFYPGEVEVGTRLTRVGGASLALAQGLFAAGSCRATASAVLVLIDVPSGASAPIPETMRARLAPLMEL